MKLLLVDDQEYNRDLLRFIMQDEGHTCIDAQNGLEAIDALDKNDDIDLVLMDVNMPKMNGIEATKHIIQKYTPRRVAIIFVTALDDSDVLAKCLNAGADGFVPKPVNESILISKVNAGYQLISDIRQLNDARN